jgi:hypothetical protein
MKIYKLFMTTAAACLLAAFVSGAAQAEPLEDIVEGYCDSVGQTVDDAYDELFDAYQQGAECISEVQSCTEDLGPRDSASRCLRDFSRCGKRAERPQVSACTGFLREWSAETKIAERLAKRNGVLPEFYAWVQGIGSVSPTSTECFFDAYQLAEDCFEE